MLVSIFRATCPSVIEREVVISAKKIVYTLNRINIEVDEFREFISMMYRAYANLSRQSGEAVRAGMLLPVKCEVNSIVFFVRCEDGGVRYGRE